MGRIRLANCEETMALGERMARDLPKGSIIALSGDLGAGKTTFVQGLARGLNILEPIQSPTFTILNIYKGLAHFDLYRLKGKTDFLSLGFDEYFYKEELVAIEWSERIADILPSHAIRLHFGYEENARWYEIL